ncbi:MAG: heme ABC exporter ATP-binding protein CcmA [Burkholderiaceae bacterium]
MLELQQLSCLAGYRPLFSGLNASLQAGQWLMLTGPNGTGKTTLLRALAGLVRPQAGAIRWQNAAVNTTSLQWRQTIHYLGHSSALKDSLSAHENLSIQLTLDLGANPGGNVVSNLLEQVGLAHRAELAVARLSAGQRRRVQLARLAVSNRRLWLLDEPGNALDADGNRLLGNLLDRHLGNGGTAVIATHQSLTTTLSSEELNLSRWSGAEPAAS